jgi:DivIVA domain-containing protein
MLTLVLFGLLAILVAGVLFLVAAYLLPAGEQIAPPIRDEPLWDLPSEQRLAPGDVLAVRLPVALRGYRFAETDLLLDRLADELRDRDDEITRLKTARDPYFTDQDAAAGEPPAVADGHPEVAQTAPPTEDD